MPELTFRSAGVSSREIDLTGATGTGPVGVPAGVVGTAIKGPAFVPVTVGSYQDFVNRFGPTDGEKFAPLAVYEWLRRARALTFTRILGAGDGKKRNTGGTVTNAGFIVGAKQVQETGVVATNPYAELGGPPGRTHFLGCFMSQSSDSTIFSDAGIQKLGEAQAQPILRGVIMAASGVALRLSGAVIGANSERLTAGTSLAGLEHRGFPFRGDITGTVNINDSKQEFVMLLNGHKHNPNEGYPSVVTASFDPEKGNYFAKVFNTDPLLMEKSGHYLYSSYDIHPALAVITGTGVLDNAPSASTNPRVVDTIGNPVGKYYVSGLESVGFITTGTLGRNAGNGTTTPNYENFQDRFGHAKTPFITSQKFGSNPYDLFRIHHRSDGSLPLGQRVKISIRGLSKQANDNSYGTFSLDVRDESDTDGQQVVLESFNGLSMDPNSDRFFARIIGDKNIFFDFDQGTSSQRLVVDGDYDNRSKYIRVEQSNAIKGGQVPNSALPFGYRGPSHLVTSGSDTLTTLSGTHYGASSGASPRLAILGRITSASLLSAAVQPPIPFRKSVSIGPASKLVAQPQLYWGTVTRLRTNDVQNNKFGDPDNTFTSYGKYFPDFQTSNINFSVGNNAGTADVGGIVLDSDRFNNNKFTLENIKVRTKGAPSTTVADPAEWMSASYVRGGNISDDTTLNTRAFKLDDLGDTGNKAYAKFTCLMQGGFDGVNIFNKDQRDLTNPSVKREIDDNTAQGGLEGPTVAAYRKAVDIMGNSSDVDIKLLAIPGIRDASVTDYAISAVENRFDAMYIMDIEERDTINRVVTSSNASQVVDVSNTITAFKNRSLDTSFAASYFPDVIMTDPKTNSNVKVPASVAVLGAFALNDSVGHPWFAPAGFTRGSLDTSLFASVDLNRCNLDDLYDAAINPITDFPGKPLTLWGQKTLQVAATSLDRVNVRRLLIEVRRQVKAVARRLLFEPNRPETLARFSSLVNPIMQSIQQRSGVDRYKVVIDTTTTTQADVENNTIRGKIFLQPTRTAEFISLDFVVTNAGSEI